MNPPRKPPSAAEVVAQRQSATPSAPASPSGRMMPSPPPSPVAAAAAPRPAPAPAHTEATRNAAATKIQSLMRGHLGRMKAKEEKFKQVASRVAPPSREAFDCDRWAADFQQALSHDRLPFTAVKYAVRPEKQPSAIATGARIEYSGAHIGHDTHFFTKVQVGNKKQISFDNVNPQGVESREHAANFRFFLSPYALKQGDDSDSHVPVAKRDHVLTYVKKDQSFRR
ncbi:hypothetical protein KIH87_03405 [Paraneptunicella aestuarii]|uniref:IQ calmodulin-binding motif-containing protein n=1 Tax=Paraneptunicella aestuarii TaxID=2831148 RepID=UPI001E2F6314|nr:hypothetical protein [Paraneptunicella aestuarii]UAA39418.1 hypothetical protein KIH87_03405 [Paraneptunicella aestuarii]